MLQSGPWGKQEMTIFNVIMVQVKHQEASDVGDKESTLQSYLLVLVCILCVLLRINGQKQDMFLEIQIFYLS